MLRLFNVVLAIYPQNRKFIRSGCGAGLETFGVRVSPSCQSSDSQRSSPLAEPILYNAVTPSFAVTCSNTERFLTMSLSSKMYHSEFFWIIPCRLRIISHGTYARVRDHLPLWSTYKGTTTRVLLGEVEVSKWFHSPRQQLPECLYSCVW